MARGFWPLARRERGAYPRGSVTSEQRGQRPKEPARPGIFSFSERLSGCHHAIWLFLLWQFSAHFGAAETGAPSPEYLVRDWQMEDGLPDSSVKTILQTREGYLWVGTDNGLARFDGVQFKTFNPQNTPELRSGRIRCLLQDRRGVLWIGTEGGELAFLAQGKFQSFSPDPGRQTPSHISGLLEDSNGAVWACVGGDELVLVRSGAGDAPAGAEASVMGTPVPGAKARRAGIKVPGAMIGSPVADSGGRVWIPSGEGLCAFDGARLTREAGLPDIQVVARKPGGGVWTGGANWLRAYEPGEAKLGNPEVLPWAAERSEIQITALCADQAGGLWVGTFINGVVYRERQGAWRYVVHDGPLFQNIINCIFEDREGTIWIGTEDAGLYRVRRRVVTALPLPPEFRDLTVLSAWAARDGSVWLGTEGAGVFSVSERAVHAFCGTRGFGELAGVPGDRGQPGQYVGRHA